MGCVVGGGAQRCCLICVQVYGYSVGREGPTRGITAPCFIRCTVEIQPRLVSLALGLSALRPEGQHRAK